MSQAETILEIKDLCVEFQTVGSNDIVNSGLPK